MTNFVSVATSAARYQDISLNPQKLAGQCAKLKCCLNYEVDAYVEGVKRLPSREVVLETKTNSYFHFKTDIFKRLITYSTDKSIPANLVTIPAERAFEVIALNKRGVKPDNLGESSDEERKSMKEFGDIVGQDSVTRFDKVKKKKRNRNGGGGNGNANGNGGRQRPNGGNGAPNAGGQSNENPAPQTDKSNNKGNNNRRQENGEQRNNQRPPRPKGNGENRNGQQRRNNDRQPRPPKGEK